MFTRSLTLSHSRTNHVKKMFASILWLIASATLAAAATRENPSGISRLRQRRSRHRGPPGDGKCIRCPDKGSATAAAPSSDSAPQTPQASADAVGSDEKESDRAQFEAERKAWNEASNQEGSFWQRLNKYEMNQRCEYPCCTALTRRESSTFGSLFGVRKCCGKEFWQWQNQIESPAKEWKPSDFFGFSHREIITFRFGVIMAFFKSVENANAIFMLCDKHIALVLYRVTRERDHWPLPIEMEIPIEDSERNYKHLRDVENGATPSTTKDFPEGFFTDIREALTTPCEIEGKRYDAPLLHSDVKLFFEWPVAGKRKEFCRRANTMDAKDQVELFKTQLDKLVNISDATIHVYRDLDVKQDLETIANLPLWSNVFKIAISNEQSKLKKIKKMNHDVETQRAALVKELKANRRDKVLRTKLLDQIASLPKFISEEDTFTEFKEQITGIFTSEFCKHYQTSIQSGELKLGQCKETFNTWLQHTLLSNPDTYVNVEDTDLLKPDNE